MRCGRPVPLRLMGTVMVIQQLLPPHGALQGLCVTAWGDVVERGGVSC